MGSRSRPLEAITTVYTLYTAVYTVYTAIRTISFICNSSNHHQTTATMKATFATLTLISALAVVAQPTADVGTANTPELSAEANGLEPRAWTWKKERQISQKEFLPDLCYERKTVLTECNHIYDSCRKFGGPLPRKYQSGKEVVRFENCLQNKFCHSKVLRKNMTKWQKVTWFFKC